MTVVGGRRVGAPYPGEHGVAPKAGGRRRAHLGARGGRRGPVRPVGPVRRQHHRGLGTAPSIGSGPSSPSGPTGSPGLRPARCRTRTAAGAAPPRHPGREPAGHPRRYLALGCRSHLLFLFVLVRRDADPAALEVARRSEGNPAAHVQPEVPVVEQAAIRLAHGQTLPRRGEEWARCLAVQGEPNYESFFPYLPLMTVFGLPSSTHDADPPHRRPDLLQRGDPAGGGRRAGHDAVGPERKQGPDLAGADGLADRSAPAGHRRRRHADRGLPAPGHGAGPATTARLMSGIVLGIVSAMKFTAWPFAVLALFAGARPKRQAGGLGQMALGFAGGGRPGGGAVHSSGTRTPSSST